ncbi:MAG TPA: 3-deoxy-7-phosphoheptulonate synthase, partial [Anaerolineae bacterium]
MIIVMKHSASAAQIAFVVNRVETEGFHAHLSQGTERTIIGVVGDDRPVEPHLFELLDGVENVVRILQPFKLASRDFHPEDTVITIPPGGPALSGDAGRAAGPNGHAAALAPAAASALAPAPAAEPVAIGGNKLVIM